MQKNEPELNWQIETYLNWGVFDGYKRRSQFKFSSINEFRIELSTDLAALQYKCRLMDISSIQASSLRQHLNGTSRFSELIKMEINH